MAKKEKKEKTIEQYRKGYKKRGIFYIVMVILLLAATIATGFEAGEKMLYTAVYPKSMKATIDGTERKVYSKLEKEEGIDYASFYYKDKDGKKVDLPSYKYKDSKGKTHNNSLSFNLMARFISRAIIRVIRVLLAVFVALLVIYSLRFSYYLSNKDEEWGKIASDKLFKIRMMFDKPRKKKTDKKK